MFLAMAPSCTAALKGGCLRSGISPSIMIWAILCVGILERAHGPSTIFIRVLKGMFARPDRKCNRLTLSPS